MKLWESIKNWWAPMCPSGRPHREVFTTTRSAWGERFCFHADCRRALAEKLEEFRRIENSQAKPYAESKP